MDKNETIEIIKKLINKANNLNDNKKDLLVAKLKSYMSYMYYTNHINSKEYNFLYNKINDNKRDNKINQFDKVRINNLIKNNNILMKYYDEISDIYDQYNLNYVNSYCNYLDISSGMISFFKYLNIYDLFKKILNNKMIAKNELIGDMNLTINNYDDSYIVVGNFSKDDLFYYSYFVHEMGHVYVNNILKEKRLYNPSPLFSEVIPLLFERMFYDFLAVNKIITSSEIKRLKINVEASHSFEIIWAYDTCRLIKENNYILENLKVITVSDPDYKYHTLYNHYYAIANYVSIYLMNKYYYNKDLFIKNLSNIIEELNNLTLKDLLNNYYDSKLIKKYIKSNLDKM